MEKRTKNWRFRSLKQQLIIYNSILLFFVLLIVLFSIFSYSKTLKMYDIFSAQYTDLSSFYRELKAGSINAQNYLYGKNVEQLESYRNHVYSAKQKLYLISERTKHSDLKWRLMLLGNMIQTYEETFDTLVNHNLDSIGAYTDEYYFLVNTANNIDATAPQYYTLLTDEMNEVSIALQILWRRQMILIFSVIGLMILISVVFSSACIWGITKPIQKIVTNINEIKRGRYNLKEVNHAGQEISVLCDAFGEMAQSVQLYIKSTEEKAKLEKKLLEIENKNLKMNELLMETELKALQGQMNPHFLFNTLSMIAKMAYMENAPETRAMMETVADLLRYSLDKSAKTSDLFGEIECIKNYYEIQRKRIGHRVAFSLLLAEDLHNIPMPGMILQPLVENAVLHGVSKMTCGARIDVSIFTDAENLYVTVEDNGIGMPQVMIDKIMSGDNSIESKTGMNIGLQNVLKRLDIFYGNNYKMKIISDIGEGTFIILTLSAM